MQTIELDKIKFKELVVACKTLNESGLLKEPINCVENEKAEVVTAFIDAVMSIPDDENGEWTGPASVALYYTQITSDESETKIEKTTIKKEKKTKMEAANESKQVKGESRPAMLKRKIAEHGGNAAKIEDLLGDTELLEKFANHKSWIKNDFAKLTSK